MTLALIFGFLDDIFLSEKLSNDIQHDPFSKTPSTFQYFI